MNLLTELKAMQARIDAETDPARRAKLTKEFKKLMHEVKVVVHTLPSFKAFKTTLN